jgi:hypothetical protein
VDQRPRVVAAVGPQLIGGALLVVELVEQPEQMASLVFVAGAQLDRERQPVSVYGEVVAATGLTAVGAGNLAAPFFASTVEASTITRDQSSVPASASRCCNCAITSSNTPRERHSSIRRRHVSPLGSPNCRYGISVHGVLV